MAGTIKVEYDGKTGEIDISSNILNISTVRSAFLLPWDSVVCVKYQIEGKLKICDMTEKATGFVLPLDFSSLSFVVESDRAPTKSLTPMMEASNPKNPYYPSLKPDPAPCAASIVKWMFYLHDEVGKASTVCIHPRFFASFRHGTHKRLIVGQKLKLFKAGTEIDEQAGFDVHVTTINEALDFILLKSNTNIVERGPIFARAYDSDPFILAGYGDDKGTLSYLSGSVDSVHSHYFTSGSQQKGPFILGSCGSSRGHSGGGIWGARGLLGINVGCSVMPQTSHDVAIAEAAVFRPKNLISEAIRIEQALMEELSKEQKEKGISSPPRRRHGMFAEFGGPEIYEESSN